MHFNSFRLSSLAKTFLHYIVPTVISMWIFAFYTIVDGFFVARGVGPDALAAVNLSMPFNNFIFAAGLLFATGTSTVLSFSLGEGSLEKARELFSQNLFLVALLGLLIGAAVLCSLESVALFLGATEVTLEYVKGYVKWIAVFAVFFIVSYNLEVQVKANGAPQITALGVGACGMANIVLDYIFVIRLGWGVEGASLATGLSQAISTAIFLIYFLTHRKTLRIQRFHWRLSIYRQIIKIGIPNCFMELASGMTIFLFNMVILRVIGNDGVICYTVLAYIFTFAANTMSGITQGMQPLVSFHCGAGDHDTFRRLLKYGILSVFACSVFMVAGLTFFGKYAVGIFLEAQYRSLFNATISALRLYDLSFLLMGYNILISGFLTAINHPEYSLVISLCRSLVFLFISLTVMSAILGETGIWLSAFVSEAMCLVVTAALYRNWKKRYF
ncbi:MAG: MATE family efflux transporter [Eubacteriales bacterium]|nr:MATE family efflux transporter [Eubacteriales bacterium]